MWPICLCVYVCCSVCKAGKGWKLVLFIQEDGEGTVMRDGDNIGIVVF